MTFADWQRISPNDAARELTRRLRALSPAREKAMLAVVLDEESLAAGFAAAPFGSPLRGVPFLAKDLFDVAGLPTRAGSAFLSEVRATPAKDGAFVRDMRAAGAVFAGKTHMVEFAWGLTGENPHYGDCEHPGFPGRTSGGSSSGSAAAVAAGIVPLALGSDTGGSIREPAAFCGLFGFRGAPHHPWIADAFPLAHSFDTAGWFTRTAADLRATLAALVGASPRDRTPRGCFLEAAGLDPEVAEAFRTASEPIAAPADAATRDALADGFAGAAGFYTTLAAAESWEVHRNWADRYRDRYGPTIRWRLDRARAITEAEIEAASRGAAAVRACWSEFFETHDFLVLPAAPFEAQRPADFTEASRGRVLALTAPASLGGLPVVTVPFPLRSGLTGGLQIIGKDPTSPAFEWGLERMADGGYV